MSTIAERVAKGVEYMDTYAPADWRERINVESLDIGDAHKCIFGQVFRTNNTCCGWCAHIDTFHENSDLRPHDYGFDGGYDDCEELTAEWQSVLTV